MLRHFDNEITSLAFVYGHLGAKKDRGNRVYAIAARIIRPGQTPLEFASLVQYLNFTSRERLHSNLSKAQVENAPHSTQVSGHLKAFLEGQTFIFSLNDHTELEEIHRVSGIDRIVDLNLAAEFFLPDMLSHTLKSLWETLFQSVRNKVYFTAEEVVELAIELVKHICGVRLSDGAFSWATAIRYYLEKSNTLFGTAFLHVARNFKGYFGGLLNPCSAEDTSNWTGFLKEASRGSRKEEPVEPWEKVQVSEIIKRYGYLSGFEEVDEDSVPKQEGMFESETSSSIASDSPPEGHSDDRPATSQKGFQYRPSQVEFSEHVAEAINGNSIVCIEAGTGTGKTVGYLIPVMEFLMRNRHARVAISTYTKNLQEQIFQKEIAFLKMRFKAYREIPVAVLKGKSSYLCAHKLSYYLEGDTEGTHLLAWLYLVNICFHFEKAEANSIGDAAFSYFNQDSFLSDAVRSSSAKEGCPPTHISCPAQVVTARARDARLIITNHHKLALLDRDVILSGLFRNCIIDEANHFEAAVRSAQKEEISSKDVSLSLRYLKQAIGKIDIRASGEHKEMLQRIVVAIESLETALLQFRYALGAIWGQANQAMDEKALPSSHDRFKGGHVSQHFKEIGSAASKLTEGLTELEDEDRCRMLRIVSRTAAKIRNERNFLKSFHETLIRLEKSASKGDRMVSYRISANNFLLSAALVDVAGAIRNNIYKTRDWIVYTAATLCYKQSFDWFKKIVGLDRPLMIEEEGQEVPIKVQTVRIPSPFKRDAMEILVPEDAVAGKYENKEVWLDYIVQVIPSLIKQNKGRTLVLFASYSDLAYVIERVSENIDFAMYPLLIQEPGKPTVSLCEHFLAVKESVLFGVETFWYGVDFKGDTLTQVIITRLPYPSISSPLQEARKSIMSYSEYWERYRFDMDSKLRQGIGRLIRSHTDKGRVLLLDSRLEMKEYGAKYAPPMAPANHLDKKTRETSTDVSEATAERPNGEAHTALFFDKEPDFSGIDNLNGTYKGKSLRKIDVLNLFKHTDLKERLTDSSVRRYIEDISRITGPPSLTTVVRVLRASKSKRIPGGMKKLPFWGFLSNRRYPGLRSTHIKPFIYPFLSGTNYEASQKGDASAALFSVEGKDAKLAPPFSSADPDKSATDEALWEPPDDGTKDFVQDKIIELNSIENVNRFYSSDSLIDSYARRVAKDILSVRDLHLRGITGSQESILVLKKGISKLPHPRSDDSFCDPRLLLIRKKFSRAYELWTAEEDRLLLEKVCQELSITVLAELFQRQPGAIRSRVAKLAAHQKALAEDAASKYDRTDSKEVFLQGKSSESNFSREKPVPHKMPHISGCSSLTLRSTPHNNGLEASPSSPTSPILTDKTSPFNPNTLLASGHEQAWGKRTCPACGGNGLDGRCYKCLGSGWIEED